MDFFTLLIFGVLVGTQHAFEADHLAAVAALDGRRHSRRALVLRGSVWGLGHTFTLLTICGVLLLLDKAIPPRIEAMLEFVVGAMIVLLGLNIFRTIWKKRPHFHAHRHPDGERHVHMHMHVAEEVAHRRSPHDHEHLNLGLGRALVVGMVHGAAGSAGLLILAAAAQSISEAVGYVLAFGLGSIIGMAALSFVAAYPLRMMERAAGWVSTAAFVSIGVVAIFIGVNLLGHNWNLL